MTGIEGVNNGVRSFIQRIEIQKNFMTGPIRRNYYVCPLDVTCFSRSVYSISNLKRLADDGAVAVVCSFLHCSGIRQTSSGRPGPIITAIIRRTSIRSDWIFQKWLLDITPQTTDTKEKRKIKGNSIFMSVTFVMIFISHSVSDIVRMTVCQTKELTMKPQAMLDLTTHSMETGFPVCIGFCVRSVCHRSEILLTWGSERRYDGTCTVFNLFFVYLPTPRQLYRP